MEFFKTNTKIQFMRQRKWAAIFSILLFVGSIVSIAVNGLNLGLDFTGGTQVIMHFDNKITPDQVRAKMVDAGFKQATAITYGTIQDISIKIGPQKISTDQITKKVNSLFAPDGKINQISTIGPEVGKTLLTNGILAIIVSLIATMIYIAFRFEYRFAISSAIALIHDPVLILGIFAYFHFEFDLTVLAAVLTVIGYSLNDTIVVYDRVRENFHKVRRKSTLEIMDLSINQTLSRTIMTSGFTLIVVVVLFFFGGEAIHYFSLALIIGIVIGTYSSIYVAGSLAVALGLTRESLISSNRKEVDATP